MFNWDDLQFFIQVARTGSLSGAARALKVNHSTVYRRILDLERQLQARLFDRLQDGYSLTATGEKLLMAAGQVEEGVQAIERQVIGQDVRLSGAIRATTTDDLAIGFLQPLLLEFYKQYPGIQVELMVDNQLTNLSKREADIAIRPSADVPDTLVGRRLPGIAFAVYGAKKYLKLHRQPIAMATLDKHQWVAGDDSLAHLQASRWLREHVPNDNIVFRSNTLLAQFAAVKTGLGLGVLPCFLAIPDPDLARLLEVDEKVASEFWLLTHADLRYTARVRAFMEFMAEAIGKRKALLDGTEKPSAAINSIKHSV
ncbi:MAG: LysR family transcriptional regulator [Burkholderiales bacterium]